MALSMQLFALLAIGLSGCLGMKLTLKGTASEVTPGESLNLTCRITDRAKGSVVNWKKVSEEETVNFASNHILKEDYKDGRFHMELVQVADKEYDIILAISEVKLEDAGMFEVNSRFGESETVDRFNLTVRVDPEPPVLMFDGAVIKGGEVFEMEQDTIHNVGCEVHDASPQAILMIKAGEFGVSGGPDDGYELLTEKKIENGEFIGFYDITYDSVLRGLEVKFDARYANREVRCEVKGRPDLRSPSFKTKFPGMSPLWGQKCSQSLVTYNGAHNIALTCPVTADPPATVQIVWDYRNPEADSNFVIDMDMAVEDRPVHYGVEVQEVDESTSNVSLIIHHVKPQMFRTYTFVAKNDLGTSNFTITLQRDLAREVSTGTASSMSAISGTFLLLSAIYFLLH